MHACKKEKSQRSPRATNPIGRSNLDDQLNGIFHEISTVPSHHQSALQSLRGLDGRNNALDEVLGIMRVLLEHSHPLSQAACSWLLVAVRIGLDNTDFHHFAQEVCLCDPGANRDVELVTLSKYTHSLVWFALSRPTATFKGEVDLQLCFHITHMVLIRTQMVDMWG